MDEWFLEIIERWGRRLQKLMQMAIANNRNNFEIALWLNSTRFQNGKDAYIYVLSQLFYWGNSNDKNSSSKASQETSQ